MYSLEMTMWREVSVTSVEGDDTSSRDWQSWSRNTWTFRALPSSGNAWSGMHRIHRCEKMSFGGFIMRLMMRMLLI